MGKKEGAPPLQKGAAFLMKSRSAQQLADAHDGSYQFVALSSLRRPPFFPPAERKVGKKRRKGPMVP